MKPIIGIGGNHLTTELGNQMEKTYTPQGFIDGVQVAGGIPLVIPISDPMDAEHYINAV
ncbi:MAG: gamma-glutamyl-gamma-aminobutyrate hydrolase family protein, partial [Trichococcus flocculiformis]